MLSMQSSQRNIPIYSDSLTAIDAAISLPSYHLRHSYPPTPPPIHRLFCYSILAYWGPAPGSTPTAYHSLLSANDTGPNSITTSATSWSSTRPCIKACCTVQYSIAECSHSCIDPSPALPDPSHVQRHYPTYRFFFWRYLYFVAS